MSRARFCFATQPKQRGPIGETITVVGDDILASYAAAREAHPQHADSRLILFKIEEARS